MIADMPLALPFRYKASFSSWGYVIAKLVIEKITGDSWSNLIKTRIFRPLGMTHSYTSVRDVLNVEPQNYAYPHGVSIETGTRTTVPIYPRDINTIFDGMVNSAGAALFSINDMAKYLLAVQEKKIPGVSAMTYDMVTMDRLKSITPRVINQIEAYGIYISDYSFGLLNGNYKGKHFHCHNGGTLGQSTLIITFPYEKISIAFATNQFSYSLVPELLIATYIFDQLKGIENNDINANNICEHSEVVPLSPRVFLTIPANVQGAGKYEGTYENNVYGTLTVTKNPENSHELLMQIGIIHGKLRAQNSLGGETVFRWWTENVMDCFEHVVTFKQSGNEGRAESVEIVLDETVDAYSFGRV